MERNFILFLLVMALIPVSCVKQAEEKPNIVFIIADDISWNDFGCYGNEDVRTPNIDKLAGKGLKFNNMYLTASSCSPSRTSIISGRYPHNTGSAELHTPLPAHLTVFPEELKEAGYFTAASGKWHMGEAPKRAFDTLTISDFGPGGEKHWINMLKERPADKPFFLWLASIDAHREWQADSLATPHNPDDLSLPHGLIDRPDSREDLAKYYDEIQRFDRYVGMVWDELKKQGVEQNTLIIVMADNGRPFPRAKTRVYDSGMKTPFIAWWPKGINGKGDEVDALVSIIDLAPTLTGLAGIEADPYYQGKSFASLFEQPESEFREVVFAEHNWHDYEAYERMVRTRDYLYVYNARYWLSNPGPTDIVTSPSMHDILEAARQGEVFTDDIKDVLMLPRPMEEMYSIQKDPYQLVNMAEWESYRDTLMKMRSLLMEWQMETADTEPENTTKDWYLREGGTYSPTAFKDQRGEMPGASLGADTVTAKGPF